MPTYFERSDVPSNPLMFPKTIELEQRLARNEVLVQDIQDLVKTLEKRIVSLQAQLDHLMASLNRY